MKPVLCRLRSLFSYHWSPLFSHTWTSWLNGVFPGIWHFLPCDTTRLLINDSLYFLQYFDHQPFVQSAFFFIYLHPHLFSYFDIHWITTIALQMKFWECFIKLFPWKLVDWHRHCHCTLMRSHSTVAMIQCYYFPWLILSYFLVPIFVNVPSI